MGPPRVSITIPAYNSTRFIHDTIRSVLAQTSTSWELIVVDDGSTDSTAAIVHQYADRDSRIRCVSKDNGGVVSALNRGLAHASASTDYCVTLGHDDVLEPDMIQVLTQRLDADPGAVAAHGMPRYIDGNGAPISSPRCDNVFLTRHAMVSGRMELWPLDRPVTFECLICHNCIPASGIVFRRSAAESEGGFDPKCQGAEDHDMWLRLSLRGLIHTVERVVVAYRLHENNLSNNLQVMGSGNLNLYAKLMKSPILDSARKQAAVMACASCLRDARNMRLKWAGQAIIHMHGIQAAKQLRHAVRHQRESTIVMRSGSADTLLK